MSYVYKQAEKEIDGVKYRLQIQQDEGYENPREWDNLGTMICFHSRYNLGDKHDYSEPRDMLIDLLENVFENDDSELESFAEKKFEDHFVHQDEDGDWYVTDDHVSYNAYSGEYYDNKYEAIEELESLKDDFIGGEWQDIMDNEDMMDIVEKYYVILPLYLYDHSGITMNTSGFHCNWDSGQVGWIYASKKTFIDETGYTQDELFNTDKNRIPKTKELVKLKGYDDSYGHYGFGKVIFINKDIITVDYDFHKIESARSKDNIVTVNVSDIVEVKSDSAKEMLRNEVELYDQYLTGEVYGFIIEKYESCECCGNGEWEHVDSCWGFYGNESIKNDMIEHVEDKLKVLFDELKYA